MTKIKFYATILLAFAAFTGFAQQSAEELVNEALGHLKTKNYKEASSSLQFALNEVNRLMMEAVIAKLPADINGFQMQKEENNNSSSMGMMGAGLSVTRHYYKNGKQAEGDEPYFEFGIIGNSASIAAVTMWMSNPMILSASGAKTMKIGTRKGILKVEGDNRIFQLPLTSSMFTITGYNFKAEADFSAIINKINFDEIIKALGE